MRFTRILLASSFQRLSAGSGLTPYISSGPLAKKLPPQIVEREWKDAAGELCVSLALDVNKVISTPNSNPTSETAVQRERVFHWYLPVLFWLLHIRDALLQARSKREGSSSSKCMVVGVSAPQGCGKTTLTRELVMLLQNRGISAVSISIDDFYLTGAEQDVIASTSGNLLLASRGNAGTHDLKLGLNVIEKLRRASQDEAVAIPRYDKSLRGGKGDRAPPDTWPTRKGPFDIILLEGWMLGFRPLNTIAEAMKASGIDDINRRLKEYTVLNDVVDVWLVVKVEDASYVRTWRWEAEEAMMAQGKPGMTKEQVEAFVNRFMPAYDAYLPGLYSHGPENSEGKPILTVTLDKDRRPVGE